MQDAWISWKVLQQSGKIYTPRTGHSIVSIGKEIYLFAGIDEDDKKNDLYALSIETNEWRKIDAKGDIPPARSGCQIAGFDSYFLMFGGYTRKNGDYFNDLSSFSIETSTWTQIKTKNPPSPRTDHTFVRISPSTCACFGGQNFLKIMNDFYIYRIPEKEWAQVLTKDSSAEPGPRFGHTATLINYSLFVFGGWNGTNTLNDLWEFSFTRSTWTKLKSDNRVRERYRHSAVHYNRSLFIFGGVDKDSSLEINGGWLYVIGGFDGQRKNDMYAIDLNLAQIEFASKVLPALGQHQSTTSGQRGIANVTISKENSLQEYIRIQNATSNEYMLKAKLSKQDSGGTPTKTDQQSMLQRKQVLNRWFYLGANGDIFPPRTGHSVVVLNDTQTIYVFGGVDDYGQKNSEIYKYSIPSNSWSIHSKPILENGFLPKPRSGCKAIEVADGKILYFGGNFDKESGFSDEVFLFNTKNGSWMKAPLTESPPGDSPLGRTDHTMTNFFNNIYVHGGYGEGKKIFGDFFRLCLKTWKWKKIKCEAEHQHYRFGHSAVLYDHSIYFFGGWDGADCLNDMMQYSISTNIWYSVKDIGVRPVARYRHDATICQNRMYLFGGVDKTQNRFNDFYEFDFSTRSWLKIITTGCIPPPRTFHRLVSFQSQIFILGGFNGLRNNDIFTVYLPQRNIQVMQVEIPPSKDEHNLSVIEDFEVREFMEESKSEASIITLLKNQVKELHMKLQTEEEKSICKICFIHEINCLLMDCCHYVTCFDCSLNLTNTNYFGLLGEYFSAFLSSELLGSGIANLIVSYLSQYDLKSTKNLPKLRSVLQNTQLVSALN